MERPVDLLRLKSRSSPRRGDSANKFDQTLSARRSLPLRRQRGRRMNRLFRQARGISLNRTALSGGLTNELGLNLGRDVNSDRHAGVLLRPMPLPYSAAPSDVNRFVRKELTIGDD